MPCSDSSSSIVLHLDNDEKFKSFEYAKITCGREITADTGLSTYFTNWSLEKILKSSFFETATALGITAEDAQFILYMEWDALRAAIGEYLGTQNDDIDSERCRISSINHTEEGIEVALVIFPPKELPKILPCSLGDKK